MAEKADRGLSVEAKRRRDVANGYRREDGRRMGAGIEGRRVEGGNIFKPITSIWTW